MVRLLETVFHAGLILLVFVSYFGNHLHFAFWFAVAWAVYLLIALSLRANADAKLDDALEGLDDIKRRVVKH